MEAASDDPKPHRGRPRKEHPRRAANTVHVTLSDEERGELKDAAWAARKDLAVFIRDAAINAANLTRAPEPAQAS
jgi:uncharacterized protein (DUF1778 family)